MIRSRKASEVPMANKAKQKNKVEKPKSEATKSKPKVDKSKIKNSKPEKIKKRTLTPEVLPPSTKSEAPTAALVPSSSTDPVARYMAEIRKYPLLTKEEEYDLAVRYRETGDREAAQKLVTSNLRFVVKIAMEYSKFGARLIDLIQEGNVGLMQAVKEFNPYKGVRLITYAVWWIRGQIQEFLMRHYSMVRIGTTHSQRKLFYELQRSRAQLEQMGMESGLMQISGRLGIPEDEVKSMSARVLQRDVSLDKPLGHDNSTTLLETKSDVHETSIEERLGRNEELHILKENIEKIRPTLSERENYILEKRLLADEPTTLQEIGDVYGITREAARQMEARLIDKIRKQMLS